jgi:hypothetical protein
MSDCKHFWIMPNAPEFVDIICRTCRKPLLAAEANAIINRAERAEERVKELDIQLSEANNLLGLALATFNASQGNSKIIISEWLKENDK